MRIFTTGAHLESIQCTINGIKTWRWVVVGFEDDTFYDGEVFNPPEDAETEDKLTTAT